MTASSKIKQGPGDPHWEHWSLEHAKNLLTDYASSATSGQWFFHASNNFRADCFGEAIEFLHAGDDLQGLIDFVPRTTLLQCAFDHVFRAWFTASDDYHDN